MKRSNKIIFIICSVFLVLLLLVNLMSRYDIARMVSFANINPAVEHYDDACAKNVPFGIYDLEVDNSSYYGYSTTEPFVFKNISSNSYNHNITEDCEGQSFSKTDLQDLDYREQSAFKLAPGYYDVFQNISPNNYEVSSDLDDNEFIVIRTVQGNYMGNVYLSQVLDTYRNYLFSQSHQDWLNDPNRDNAEEPQLESLIIPSEFENGKVLDFSEYDNFIIFVANDKGELVNKDIDFKVPDA